MATDTERFEMLSLIVELILNEGEGVSPEDLLRAQKFHEAASAGYNMFKLRGRELVDCAMNAVRFDEVGPAESMKLVQQMIDERTDTQRIDALQRAIDAHSCVEFTNAGPNDVRQSLDLFLAQEAKDIQLAEDKWRGVAVYPEPKA